MAEPANDEGLARQEPHDGPPSAGHEEPAQNRQSGPTQSAADVELDRKVEDVLFSEIGVSTLLDRLKQSIASARDFSVFLKKRSIVEEDHAASIRKLARSTHEGLRRTDVKQGSYVNGLDELMRRHDRMAENGTQFSHHLHTMHEEIQDLMANCEKGRKYWKQVGLNSEKRVSDAELQMEKAKTKYDSLVDEYIRATTGDRSGGTKRFNLKAGKLGPQSDEEILRRVETADNDYAAKVQIANSQRQELLNVSRPQAIKSLQDLIAECDAGINLQLQRFVTFNEKILLNDALIVSPVKGQSNGQGPDPRGMRDVVHSINNALDVKTYIAGFVGTFPRKPAELKYERNPRLGAALTGGGAPHAPMGYSHQRTNSGNFRPSTPTRSQDMGGHMGPGTQQTQGFQAYNPQGPYQMQAPPSGIYGSPGGGGSNARLVQENGTYNAPPHHRPGTNDGPPAPPDKGPGLPAGPGPLNSNLPFRAQAQPEQQAREHFAPPLQQAQHPSYGLGQSPITPSSQGPPQQQSPLTQQPPPLAQQLPQQPQQIPQQVPQQVPQQAPQQVPQQAPQPIPQPGPQPIPQQLPQQQPPPPQQAATHAPRPNPRPSFGRSLEELFERDGRAVPFVVEQAITTVEAFGAGEKGIYEHPGTNPNIKRIRAMLNNDVPMADFRKPQSFFGDVYSVAATLKIFFQELPDPVLAHEMYHEYIEASKIEDDVVRRDTLHAKINNLPDASYATIRALVLHLDHIASQSSRNDMDPTSLARTWAPTLLGSDNTFDLPMQTRAIETIIVNALAIFHGD